MTDVPAIQIDDAIEAVPGVGPRTAAILQRLAIGTVGDLLDLLLRMADVDDRDALALEVADPDDRAHFADYVSLYTKTVVDPIHGTWAILDRLKAQGTPVHAITNWSAETWPEGLKVHPRLSEVFETLVVSGQEGIIKPDARIFHLLCDRAGVSPEDCIFIDDGLHNVDGARAVGMDGIHFTSPDALEAALSERGVL